MDDGTDGDTCCFLSTVNYNLRMQGTATPKKDGVGLCLFCVGKIHRAIIAQDNLKGTIFKKWV